MAENVFKSKGVFLKIIILGVSSIAVAIFFNYFLSSLAEALYMSLPVVYALYLFIFEKKIKGWLDRSRSILLFVFFLIVLGMFYYLSWIMGGRVIGKEVVLALYFLGAIFLIIHFFREVFLRMRNRLQVVLKGDIFKKGISFFIILIVSVYIIFPYVLATFSIHRPKIGDRTSPNLAYGFQYNHITLKTKDQIKLDAWYVPSRKSQKAVVIAHGLGANKSNFISLVYLWNRLNYNVLIFDFRGHGQSSGHTISFGYKERLDVQAAFDYLVTQQGFSYDNIVGYGVSFGGAALVHAAALNHQIKPIIIDSTYADFDTMTYQLVKKNIFIPSFLRKGTAARGLLFANLDLGFNLRDTAPVKSISHFRNQPVLIIHGEKDSLTPVKEAQKLYQNASDPKALYVVPGADHYATQYDEMYIKVITQFLSKCDNSGRKKGKK